MSHISDLRDRKTGVGVLNFSRNVAERSHLVAFSSGHVRGKNSQKLKCPVGIN